MIRSFLLVLALLLAAPTLAPAQDLPALFRVTGVASNDVLNIRAEPRAQSPVVGAFGPMQTGIEVIALSDDGRWGLVRSQEGVGWSSMRYLQQTSVEPWTFGTTPLVCSGTEPFWTLTFFRPSNRVEYVAPDDSFEMRVDVETPPTTLYPRTMGLPMSGARKGFAVIRQGICSDGMSDRLYGLEVQVYWQGPHSALSGCCMLQP
ncbi:MAG: SH3 domain-containing protein [Rhodobacter sp.]|nr:SH3 domain-containing protein [Paracoccaceae bacterium]MCC0078053.1 SH3 domain-containing protein [Rhodobacter sp.]